MKKLLSTSRDLSAVSRNFESCFKGWPILSHAFPLPICNRKYLSLPVVKTGEEERSYTCDSN